MKDTKKHKPGWKVTLADEVAKAFMADFKAGRIGQEEIDILKRWTRKVEEEGPESLYQTSYWNDHALDGSWKGHRSSSFGFAGRIIYRVKDKEIEVLVVRITPDHDYRKR